MRVLRATLAALVVGLVVVPVALAQGPLEITTPYPAVVADPGSTANFTVTVTTDTQQRVDLTVVAQPEGWTTSLRGGGSTISAVYTTLDPEQPQSTELKGEFTAEVVIPDEATAGQNQVVIEARSSTNATQQLTLDITIEQVEGGAVTIESDFPSQGGTADATFTFDLEVRNQSNQQVTLNYEAEAPAGWRVTARPGGDTAASSAVIDAGGFSSATVTIDPPSDVEAGTFPIIVRALGGPNPAQEELSVEITGSYDMSLTTSDNRLSATVNAGSSVTLDLVVFNDGTAPLESVTLTATPPREWEVTFDQDTIEFVEPGTSASVQMTINAAANAIAGDYVVTVNARVPEVNDRIELRTTVETSPIGGLLGLAVLGIVAVGLFFVFQRYGRR